jgi:hypothetical protein
MCSQLIFHHSSHDFIGDRLFVESQSAFFDRILIFCEELGVIYFYSCFSKTQDLIISCVFYCIGEYLHARECESPQKLALAQNSNHCFSTNNYHHMDYRMDINPNWRPKGTHKNQSKNIANMSWIQSTSKRVQSNRGRFKDSQ